MGISFQTIFAVVSARTWHLLSHSISLHYVPTVLPYEFFSFLDITNAILGVALLVFLYMFNSTYEREKDSFGIERSNLLPKSGPFSGGPLVDGIFLYMVIAVMALIWWYFRRSNVHSFAVSYFCCFYEVMGAVALFPQLRMFYKDKRVSPLLANFIVLTAVN